LVTSNDDTNPAMRAINDAFGYRHQYAIAMYRR
ncbi:MAG: hypothetical protein JWM98_3071, partial [Thermoleophilia bacterium]|nr:hypothetical protein [Thermoleophilia bacterium]